MPTSVHIPPRVIDAIDRQVRRLKISRNRFIVMAVEKELARETAWSPGFFDRLGRVAPATAAATDEMLQAIRANRTHKRPPRL